MKLKFSKLNSWLTSKGTNVPKHKYAHLLLQETFSNRAAIVQELADYVSAAHEPARRYVQNLANESLHPFKLTPETDPAHGYPGELGPITLQGYFGEIFTGLVAENYEHFGSKSWEVPAYPFQTHAVAFEQLELAKQTGAAVKEVPGRTGDDCLAFELDGTGNIARAMVCEAKCTQNHSAKLIRDNHEKLSLPNLRPVSLLRVKEALKALGNDPYAEKWIMALTRFYIEKKLNKKRCDLSCYICGQRPKRNATWISQADPHEGYTGKRELESVEAHLEKVEELIQLVYKKTKKTAK